MTQAAAHDTDDAAVGDQARKTLLAGIFFALWAGGGWLSIRRNPQIVGADFGADPGPGLLPAIVLTLLSLGAAVLIAVGLFKRSRARPTPIDWPDELRGLIGPALLCIALAVYLPMVRLIGFVPGTVLFATAVMAGQRVPALRANPRREILQIVVGTLVCLGLTWGLFIYWIGVSLG